MRDWQVGVTTHSSAREDATETYVYLTLEAGSSAHVDTEKLPLQLSYSEFQVSCTGIIIIISM